MANSPDVLVIGGGIIGLTSAYFLAKAGLSVEVLERGEFGKEASWAGAGIIPPGNPDRAATPIDKLRAIGSLRFPEFSAELRELTGIDTGYRSCGGVEFLTPEDEYALDLWRNEGIRFEVLDRGELKNLEAAVVEPVERAVVLPGVAQVRNPWHLRALQEACERVGVRLRPNRQFDRFENHPAEKYLFSAGAWTSLALDHLGIRQQLNIAPVRGQIVLFNCVRPLLQRVIMSRKHYLVPRDDGRLLVGSTEEPEAGFVKANTREAIAALVMYAERLVPALNRVEIEKTWCGLRPGSPDGLPFIGPVPGLDNVFVAAGHFRAGVQLSIGTAELVRDLLTRAKPAVPADAFRLDRVPDVTARPAFRS